MLATRPFLFILVEMCANSQGTQMEVPTPAKLLLRMCIESAKKTTFILSALQDQTLLGTKHRQHSGACSNCSNVHSRVLFTF